MSFNTVNVKTEGKIGILTLNRPDAANTFTREMGEEVVAAAHQLTEQRCRVIVVTGAGRHFCAGADLKEVAAGRGPRLGDTSFIDVFESLRIPVIAAINGSAIGGGCELALACDLRLMSRDAEIGLPEVRFGGLPAGGGTQRLPRLIGPARAKQLLWLGTPIGAQEAERIGLVNWEFPAEELMSRALELAALLAQRPAYAIEAVKFLVDRACDADLRSGLATEVYVARKMATKEQRLAAQADAAADGGAYGKIFGAE
jgi:enoyl-CoA hydratase